MYPVPRRVRIPAIDVATRVVPVGIDENEALEVPEDVHLVGGPHLLEQFVGQLRFLRRTGEQ